MSCSPTIQRDKIFTAGHFSLYADRKARSFVRMASGIADRGGCTQHILSIEEARALARELNAAADFASKPLPGEAPLARTEG
mgnify:CR=1 FL=1